MSSANRDPEQNPLEAIILSIVEPLIRFARTYPATVVTQAEDGTLDLRIDSRTSGLPDPSGVPLRGLPGSAKVKAGAAVLLGFEYRGADKSPLPFATIADGDGVLELRLAASVRIVHDTPENNLTTDAARAVLAEGDYGTFSGLTGPGVPVTGTFQISKAGSGRVKL